MRLRSSNKIRREGVAEDNIGERTNTEYQENVDCVNTESYEAGGMDNGQCRSWRF